MDFNRSIGRYHRVTTISPSRRSQVIVIMINSLVADDGVKPKKDDLYKVRNCGCT